MALSFLQPSLKISYGLLPRFDLDLPMLDEPPIGMRTLLLECDLDSMICDPPSQALKADSQLLVSPYIPPRRCNRTADLYRLSINASRWI
jgi:hypothetical protein